MKNWIFWHYEHDDVVADTVQLKCKGTDEIKADVSILKITESVAPIPDYLAVTPGKMFPYYVFVPIADTKSQLSKLQDVYILEY